MKRSTQTFRRPCTVSSDNSAFCCLVKASFHLILPRNRLRHLIYHHKQERSLFSVMGQRAAGSATALIIAADEADAEQYALHALGFVSVVLTTLVSDSVYATRAKLP